LPRQSAVREGGIVGDASPEDAFPASSSVVHASRRTVSARHACGA